MRDNAIKRYFEEHGAVPASPEAIAVYERSIGPCIEKITRHLKEQARLAHYFRLGIKPPAR